MSPPSRFSWVLVFLAIATPSSTVAQQRQSKVPNQIASCTLESIYDERLQFGINTAADNAHTSQPILQDLSRLTEMAKDGTKPIGAQLTIQDAQRFTILSERLKRLQVMTYFEEAHSRDAMVLFNMSKMATALYNGATQPADDDPALVYWSFIQVLRLMFPADKTTVAVPPRFEHCTTEWAIEVLEDESIKRLNQFQSQIDSGNAQIRRILQEQGRTVAQGIDPAQVSPSDKALIADIQRTVMLPANKERVFIADMENLKSLAKASDIIYVSNKQDFLSSGGDYDAIGTSLDKGNFDDRTKVMLGIWDKISVKVPTEWEQQMKTITNATKGLK